MEARRIPIIGNDIYQVGQVLEMISQPCAIRPWIAVRATWTYAPTLIWSLYKPDPLDLTFDRIGRPHRRVRKRRFRADAVNRLPGPTPGTTGWAFFQSADFAQRVGWYLLVLDATTDFLVNWHSMAMTWSGCKVPGVPTGWASGDGGLIGYNPPEGTEAVLRGDDSGESGGAVASPSAVGLPAGGPSTAAGTATLRITTFGGQTGNVTRVRLRQRIGGEEINSWDAAIAHEAEGVQTWAAHATQGAPVSPATSFSMVAQWTGGALFCDAFSLDATGAPSAMPDADP